MEEQVADRLSGDEVGAHVSTAGGTAHAPGRGAELGAKVIQLFTKQPNRWAEREVDDVEAEAFRAACDAHGIRVTASHDSYLINLASPVEDLYRRSLASFTAELRRAGALGLDFVVTHPGNTTDGNVDRGIRQNAAAIVAALEASPGDARVLIEGTAGTGTALGSTFEELARLVDAIGQAHPDRVGLCLDTCHLWAAGYDLRDLDGVLAQLEDTVGLAHLRFLHLNDSVTPLGSRRDRHAAIGEGTLGDVVFRAVMNHPALVGVPKVIETPKGEDWLAADRANLARLRGYRAGKMG
jgi:deoxyribonuclease IV